MESNLLYLIEFLKNYGIHGVAFGMFLESLGIPFAGISVAIGSAPLVNEGRATYLGLIILVAFAGTLGSVVSYLIGYFFGDFIRSCRKCGKVFKNEDKVKRFLDKYGKRSIFYAQLFGTTRTFVSMPAGVIKYSFLNFLVSTFLGMLIYSTVSVLLSPLLYHIWRSSAYYFKIPVWLPVILSFGFLFLGIIFYKYIMAPKINSGSKSRKNENNQINRTNP